MRDFSINGRDIGLGERVYIVAELSANHHQNFDQALDLIRAAKAAGADAVKLQTYTPDTITLDCDGEYFRIDAGSPWSGQRLYDLYQEAYTPWDWQPKLKQAAERLGMDCFSTPFDPTAVDFLEEMDVPAYKVASFEVVDLPLLARIAQTGKPVIMSTGMATAEEIEQAVQTLRENGTQQIALLKCTSSYPAPPESINLRTLPSLSARFDVPVGLSDHTLGIAVPVASVALGAAIIEKHLTLSRETPGPDSAFSLEPHEFQAMVAAVRTAEKALGSVQFGPGPHEASSQACRRSLFVVKDIKRGEVLTAEHVRSIRPGHGLAPKYLAKVLNRPATEDISRGTPLDWRHLG